MSATRLAAGCYEYRGCRIEQDFDSEMHYGWWSIYDLDDVWMEKEFYPTKRAAMKAINDDPPETS